MSKGRISVRFWGTRGSIPISSPTTRRYGGNTACVELRFDDNIYILDAGTGIRVLGDSLMEEFKDRNIKANIFITHTHWDHILGFPFFIPAYVPGNLLRLHGPHGIGKSFEMVFRDLMDPSFFPVDLGDMKSKLEFIEVKEDIMNDDGVRILTTFTNHPGMNLAYRFQYHGRSVVYLTDHETYQTMNEPGEFSRKQDMAIENFCRGADLLIADAQYTDEDYLQKRTWGHSRYKDTVALGLQAEVKSLILFHHDPYHSDKDLDEILKDSLAIIKKSGRKLNCRMALDGLKVSV